MSFKTVTKGLIKVTHHSFIDIGVDITERTAHETRNAAR